MLLPSIAGLTLFVVYPIAWVFRYCMYRYTGFGQPIHVGLSNFVRILTNDPKYWDTVLNSFIFAFGKLLVELPLAFILAYILARKFHGSSLFRTLFYLPSVLSVAIVGLVFSYIFAAYNGVVNEWLLSINIKDLLGMSVPISWFSTRSMALLISMIASIWQNFGLNMLFFMTGLQSIPRDLYEAADIDGANGTQRLFRITIPMLAPITQMVVMNAILGSLKIADLILTLTNGQPAGKSEVMMTYIYKQFFGRSTAASYGYASALVIVTSVILAIVAAVYLRTTKKASRIY
ncbi:MAG: sugar ABC transporter permease [Fibrobacter sp.]|jgi:raffinose/stachyose/melibiose transport system permease protein|nr:sugar ABC transporter permease [Fibrobacter sp.]